MQAKSNEFVPLSSIAVRDQQLGTAIANGARTAYNNRLRTLFVDGREHGEALRHQAAEAKRRALRQLPDLLEQAETNLQANGIEVLWAEDAAEVGRYVIEIARRHEVQKVTKSKSMVTEEVGLNHVLETEGLVVVETDLGEYIIQLAKEPPSHIVAPILHKSKSDVRDIFVSELGMAPTDDAAEMTRFARQQLREHFLSADMGISGGNFVIAETGTIGLVTNEGNGRMVTTLPRVHVAIVGIEKLVETVDDYVTLTQILARSSTGQTMPVYTHMINGPRRKADPDGPEHVYVIFVDNGRSDIYCTDYAEALACIRCGACLNACPVYRSVGGHAYGWVYSGPIGAVITPLLIGLENATPLPNASSLCGICKEVCPVIIDLPRMLLDLRRDLVKQGHTSLMWKTGIRLWSWVSQSPRLFSLGGMMGRIGLNRLGGKRFMRPWVKHRDFPDFAPKSFRQLWKERQS